MLKKIKRKTRIRTRFKVLLQKFKTIQYIWKTDGAPGLRAHFRSGVKKRLSKSDANKTKKASDVLFISIDDPLLDRYRTDHMIEELESVGVSTDKVYYYHLTLDHVKRYNKFIFYRTPWIPIFDEFAKLAKDRNKILIYAVDDLIIDTKYTDDIPAIQRLDSEEREIYDDGVVRHKKAMLLCDYAVVTTNEMARQLEKYNHFKKVIINNNAMSNEMVACSNAAVDSVERDENRIVIGYFSGTDTHNEDFQMVAPAVVKILEEYDNVYIKLAGRITAPKQLEKYKDRIIFTPYVDWRKLPFELRVCDIILAPLVDTLFNRAKSEIKWTESALVGVSVVASDMGSFSDNIKNDQTGILVQNTTDGWYRGIKKLVEDRDVREYIGERSRDYVLGHHRTVGKAAVKLKKDLQEISPKVIAFAGVNISAISGGNMVIKKHMDILRGEGYIVYGVESMDYRDNDEWVVLGRQDEVKYDFLRINSKRHGERVDLNMTFDRYVATFWSSVDMVDSYKHMNEFSKKLYLVQNMESGFYGENDSHYSRALATYSNVRLHPITISRWCYDWLSSIFARESKYAPNGIDIDKFKYISRDFNDRKIKILIEGDSTSDYKRVDESFEIANKLDRSRYEVSYLSYKGEPKDWYRVDEVFIRVPYDKVPKIYEEHDILLKSSILESFSYPPLEMMATGGLVVLAANDGNAEYVEDGVNAMYYESGDISDAIDKIEKLSVNNRLIQEMSKSGRFTAEKRDWTAVSEEVVNLYR